MDLATRSKSIDYTKRRYSPAVKVVSFVLTLVFLFFCGVSLLTAARCYTLLGDDCLSHIDKPFTESEAFARLFLSDVTRVVDVAGDGREAFSAAFDKHLGEACALVKDAYLAQKAQLIREELIYAVTGIYDYDYSNEAEATAPTALSPAVSDRENVSAVIPPKEEVSRAGNAERETTTRAEQPTSYHVPYGADEAVREAVQALNTAKTDADLLAYAYLVREQAFYENNRRFTLLIVPDGDPVVTFYSENADRPNALHVPVEFEHLALDADALDAILPDRIRTAFENALLIEGAFLDRQALTLSQRSNLSYFAQNANGDVFSSGDRDGALHTAATYQWSAEKTDCSPTLAMQSAFASLDPGAKHVDAVTVSVLMDGNGRFPGLDAYRSAAELYRTAQVLPFPLLVSLAVCSLVLACVCAIVFLSAVGVDRKERKCVTMLIDRLPLDAHLVLSGFLTAAMTASGLIVIDDLKGVSNGFAGMNRYLIQLDRYLPVLFGLTSAGVGAVLVEFAASVVRQKRAGQKLLRRTLIGRLCALLGRLFTRLRDRIAAGSAAPLIVLTGLAALAGFADLLTIALDRDFWPGAAVLSLAFIAYLVWYVFQVDALTRALRDGKEPARKKLPYPATLQKLSDAVSRSVRRETQAVAEAVRNEQTKTALITNVSHDLKTPLTNLISYTELLQTRPIDDEEALGYVKVIGEQSVKLKRLIEDLIEASKASAGNVEMHLTRLSLTEMTVQTMADFLQQAEKNGCEIIFDEKTPQIFVTADGNRTYRILSNLFSNAVKYSQTNTRIFVDVSEADGFGVFTLRNTSREMLNISPDALTERFVRGDASRHQSGSGLGLSIAKDLCRLQNGALNISIDGDLFTAKVRLPLAD